MARTPGLIIPSAYSSKEELEKDLRRRTELAGFTPFNASDFDEEPLAHFGVKGMKWGRRKKRLDEEERKDTFKNADRNRKIMIGVAVVGGAAAIALIMSKRGREKITDAAVTNFVQTRQAKAQAGQNPFGQLAKKFRDTKAASVPSPDKMIAEARMAGVRNRFEQAGNQRLTDKAWRDAANLRRQARDIPPDRGLGDLNEVRRRLADPNYVWQL